MEDFIKIWKDKANKKSNTASDMVAYCILKAINAKSQDKEEILKYFLNRAFTIHKKNGYASLRRAAGWVRHHYRWKSQILGTDLNLTENEKELFVKLVERAETYYG